jgi:hypothetical protein
VWHAQAGTLNAMLVGACAHTPQEPAPCLAATSWQLVRFQGGDGRVQVPDDRANCTVASGRGGGVSVRLDCNRRRGSWKSERPSALA